MRREAPSRISDLHQLALVAVLGRLGALFCCLAGVGAWLVEEPVLATLAAFLGLGAYIVAFLAGMEVRRWR